jgi:hypothetical protein
VAPKPQKNIALALCIPHFEMRLSGSSSLPFTFLPNVGVSAASATKNARRNSFSASALCKIRAQKTGVRYTSSVAKRFRVMSTRITPTHRFEPIFL